jgi:NADH dehydrogenase
MVAPPAAAVRHLITMTHLVIGANGTVGRAVCDELARRGHTVERWRRDTHGDARDAGAVLRAARGSETIIDCAGASCALALGHGWRGYAAVDVPIGAACVAAARDTGARLVYVAAFHDRALARQPYIAAHERVARDVRAIGGAVIRPTGIYATFASLRALALRGVLVDVGRGATRTNPIDERDVARAVVDAALTPAREPLELDVGGPETMTRAELFAHIARTAQRRVRMLRVPVVLGRLGARALALVHPRLGQFARFGAALARHDAVAPAYGTRTLVDYLRG